MRRFRTKKHNTGTTLLWIVFLCAYLIFLFSNGEEFKSRVILDLGIFLLFFILSIIFFSQMMLPLNEAQERFLALRQIILFILHKHGLITKVQDGRIKTISHQHHGDYGIIQLDSASAAVLRIPSQYSRTVGPGVTYLEKDESVESTVDLHLQKEVIGPQLDENSFLPRRKFENPVDYRSRLERADATRAFTQDGIEIIPTFIMYFKIKSEPNAGNTPFGYDPLSVQRAVIGLKILSSATSNDSQTHQDWQLIAIEQSMNVWRDIISKMKLEQIFNKNNGGIEKIIKQISDQIILTGPPQKNASRQVPERTKSQSKSFQLDQKGIEVVRIVLVQLQFAPEVEQKIIENWISLQEQPNKSVFSISEVLSNESKKQGKIAAHIELSKKISELTRLKKFEQPKGFLGNLINTCIQIMETHSSIAQRNQTMIEKLKNVIDE